MKRTLITLAPLALAAALGACTEGYTGVSVGIGTGWHSYPYDVWYDGFYGPFYDGYWGTDGFFYYRALQNDRIWRRGDAGHFRRDRPSTGGTTPYHRFDGRTHQPQPGAQVPNYPTRNPGTHGTRSGQGSRSQQGQGDSGQRRRNGH